MIGFFKTLFKKGPEGSSCCCSGNATEKDGAQKSDECCSGDVRPEEKKSGGCGCGCR